MAETHDRMIIRLASLLVDLQAEERSAARLCEAGRRMLEADGAAITVSSAPGPALVVASTDSLAARLAELQEVVGEGPGIDALQVNELQMLDFATETDRWSSMREQGQLLGFAGSVMAVPLRPGDRPIGALLAHRATHAFEIDPAIADFLGAALGAALLEDPDLVVAGEGWASRAVVHQATGMIISQVGVRAEDALALLRGQAFANDTTLFDVAEQIVGRRINFRQFTIEGD